MRKLSGKREASSYIANKILDTKKNKIKTSWNNKVCV
jgi:hypothetical protein